jgi:RNA polymerase sigma-70 factor (ECF subfamily)
MHDRELVDAVLAGHPEAYRVLVEREAQTVVAICAGILKNAEDADDVAQEAFVRAYRSLAGYRGDGTFGAWIARIARRMAIQRAATMRRNATVGEPSMEIWATDDEANPERRLMKTQHAAALRSAIDALPADQREVLELRFYRDMPVEAIAAATHTPIGTVKSRLHRGLARLRHQTDLRSVS